MQLQREIEVVLSAISGSSNRICHMAFLNNYSVFWDGISLSIQPCCNVDAYLAYAFSSKALQNSLGVAERQKSSTPSSLTGKRSSTTTSVQRPKRQKRKWKIPAYKSRRFGFHSWPTWSGMTWNRETGGKEGQRWMRTFSQWSEG